MKVVINRCFGGFGLSDEAEKILGDTYSRYNSSRTCPALVAVVEKLGSKRASGRFAELEVVEIPDGIKWHIDEYDGNEEIHEDYRSW